MKSKYSTTLCLLGGAYIAKGAAFYFGTQEARQAEIEPQERAKSSKAGETQ